MQWNELWGKEQEPSEDQIREFVGTSLWDDLSDYLQRTYQIQPKLFYSGCSMQAGYWKGWNVKYKKGGKSLCTLYPKQGYFTALIPVGEKEMVEADFLMPRCDTYTQELYRETKAGTYGKSLPVEVTNENILEDVKCLIELRTGSRAGN